MLRKKILQTKDYLLVEDSQKNSFWDGEVLDMVKIN